LKELIKVAAQFEKRWASIDEGKHRAELLGDGGG